MDFSAVPKAVKKRVLTARKAGNDRDTTAKNVDNKIPRFRVSKGRLFSLTPREAAPPQVEKKLPLAKAVARSPQAASGSKPAASPEKRPSPGSVAEHASYEATRGHAHILRGLVHPRRFVEQPPPLKLLYAQLARVIRSGGAPILLRLRGALCKLVDDDASDSGTGAGAPGPSGGGAGAPGMRYCSTAAMDGLLQVLAQIAPKISFDLRYAATRALGNEVEAEAEQVDASASAKAKPTTADGEKAKAEQASGAATVGRRRDAVTSSRAGCVQLAQRFWRGLERVCDEAAALGPLAAGGKSAPEANGAKRDNGNDCEPSSQSAHEGGGENDAREDTQGGDTGGEDAGDGDGDDAEADPVGDAVAKAVAHITEAAGRAQANPISLHVAADGKTAEQKACPYDRFPNAATKTVDVVADAVAADIESARKRGLATLARVREQLREKTEERRPARDRTGRDKGRVTVYAAGKAGLRQALRHAGSSSGAVGTVCDKSAGDVQAQPDAEAGGATAGCLSRRQIGMALNNLLELRPPVTDTDVDDLMLLCRLPQMLSTDPPHELPKPPSFVRCEDFELLVGVAGDEAYAAAAARAAAAVAAGQVPPLVLPLHGPTALPRPSTARSTQSTRSSARKSARPSTSSSARRPAPAQFTPRFDNRPVAKTATSTLPGRASAAEEQERRRSEFWKQAHSLMRVQSSFGSIMAPKQSVKKSGVFGGRSLTGWRDEMLRANCIG